MPPLLNGFWLLLPPLAWNLAFTARLKLERAFDLGTAPAWVTGGEHLTRILCFAGALWVPMDADRRGLALYGVGLVVYFASWWPVMGPQAARLPTRSPLWFGPAVTPLLWLAGIAWAGRAPWFLALSVIFLGFHVGGYRAALRGA